VAKEREKATPEDIEMARRLCGWIRKEKHDRRLSQNAIARKLGLPGPTLSRYLTEARLPPIGVVLRVRKLLHVDAVDLLEEDPPQRFMSPEPEEQPSSHESPRTPAQPEGEEKGRRSHANGGHK
jgi:transcriptional regulator with XRE-family HTH domain